LNNSVLTIQNSSSPSSENTIFLAIVCSMLLHLCLVLIIPNLSFDEIKKPEVLEVALVKKPEPPPAAQPEPTVLPPEPVKPKVIPEKPAVKPKPLPPPTQEAKSEPESYTPPPTQLPPQTAVIAVAPAPEAPTSPVPPAPIVTPPPPPAPSQSEIDDARGRYGNALWGAIEKHKQYPRIAQIRGWQGEVILELLLDGSGKLKSKKVLASSGYEALDKQALDMVEKAAPFPTPPEALRGNSFTIKVPIPFKLEN
jgi:protein TonB